MEAQIKDLPKVSATINNANISQPGGAVSSVNGKTGAVELTAKDVGALPDTTVIPTVPTALPNPFPLTFTGAVEGSYDGSAPLAVDIPMGGGSGGGGGAETVFELVTTEELTRIDTGFTPTSADGIVMVHFVIPANTAQTTTTNFWISLSDNPNSQNYMSWLAMYCNNIAAVTQIIVPVSKDKFISVAANASTGSSEANFARKGSEKPYDKTLKIGTSSSSVIFPVGTKIIIVKYGGGLV